MNMAHKKTVTESSENEPVSSRTRSHQQKKQEEACHLSDHTEDLAQERKNIDNMVVQSGKSYNKNMDEGLSENCPGDNSNSASTTVTENKSDTKAEKDNSYKVIDDERNETDIKIIEHLTQFSEDEYNINLRKRREINKETLSFCSYVEEGQISFNTKLNRNKKKHVKNVEHIERNLKHIEVTNKFSSYTVCSILIVLDLILCCWNMPSGQNAEERRSHTDLPNTKYQSFHDMIELVKIKYPKQTERFWRIIGSQLFFRRLL